MLATCLPRRVSASSAAPGRCLDGCGPIPARPVYASDVSVVLAKAKAGYMKLPHRARTENSVAHNGLK